MAPSDCNGEKTAEVEKYCGDGVGSSDSGSGGGCGTSMTYPAARPGIVGIAVRFRENAEVEGEGGGRVNNECRQDTVSVAPIASAEATATEEGMTAATAALYARPCTVTRSSST
jgi:hypothetical protein